MKRIVILTLSLLCLGLFAEVAAQTGTNLFAEVEKALKTGDVDAFSDWFSDNLDIEILDVSHICSKNQAKQMVKKFFVKYTPKNFTFIHQSGNGKVQYGIGSLIAGGERFRVTIFIQTIEKKQSIQQIRIEKN